LSVEENVLGGGTREPEGGGSLPEIEASKRTRDEALPVCLSVAAAQRLFDLPVNQLLGTVHVMILPKGNSLIVVTKVSGSHFHDCLIIVSCPQKCLISFIEVFDGSRHLQLPPSTANAPSFDAGLFHSVLLLGRQG
jgi:hypothetical protein